MSKGSFSLKPMLKLKGLIEERGISQRAVARETGLGVATVSRLLNDCAWPVRNRDQVRTALLAYCAKHGIGADALEETAAPGCDPEPPVGKSQQQEPEMLPKRVRLSPTARRAFGCFREPFGDDLSIDDVFLTPDIRFVREAMWQTARNGGFTAVVGESGAGKSVLRKELDERISAERAPVVLVQPYVLGMEENDKKGQTLKSAAIADAIICKLAPLQSPRRTMEAKSRQLHALLEDSHRSGQKVCLIIEEAHCLPVPTLKHLKRFYELEKGFAKLLSIILIGQPELAIRLSDKNPEVREVVQRIEVVHLPPLQGHLEAYVAFRLERAGLDASKLVEASAYDALRTRLLFQPSSRRAEHRPESLLYALAVGNLLHAAMNLAADLGAATINGDIVMEATC